MISASSLLMNSLSCLVGIQNRAAIAAPTTSSPLPASRAMAGAALVNSQVLAVAGYPELTAATCKAFRKQVCAAIEKHTDVEIDLSATTVIDCAGLGAFIAIRNSIHGQGG